MIELVPSVPYFRRIQRLMLVACLGAVAPIATAQAPPTSKAQNSTECAVDLTLAGNMKDIVSNALMRGLNIQENEVAAFLDGAETRHSNGKELLAAAADKFQIREADLTAEAQKFKHCNCAHDLPTVAGQGLDPGHVIADAPISKFAQDVTLHVVLHELGHALIREFDLPVLGNEETMADGFATYYLTTYLPDRALDVLKARTTSLMIEAKEVDRDQWSVSGEHNSDARRAHQIAAIAVATGTAKYDSMAKSIGMSAQDIRSSKDYGAEIHRSWRRVLQPLWMPEGVVSGETRVKFDPDCGVASQLRESGMATLLESIVGRFDWHSQVTIYFARGDGGAGWNRSKRTVTVYSEYVLRFVRQGAIAKS